MKCLVLAFEKMEDLPKNKTGFSIIHAYGQSKISKKKFMKSPTKIIVYNQFFEIKNYHKQKEPYTFCFIKHPDPWGEPRNWMQAIAALGECLKGQLVCEFWFPHEIKAFDFLLKATLGNSAVSFIEAKRIENIKEWENYQAVWEINKKGTKKDMLNTYQKKKIQTLQRFYKKVGAFFIDEYSLKDVTNKTMENT